MRILNALKSDVKFQFKQGFYFVYIILTLLYMIVIGQIPNKFINYVVPIVIFTDPSFIGFFFIGGIVMLEKIQGVLQYLVITPLSPKEYLISKTISLTILAELAGFAITLVTYKDSFNWIILFLGILLTSIFYTLYGFIVASGCNTINQYFVKMIPYLLILIIPLLVYFSFPNITVLKAMPPVSGFNLIYGAFNGIKLIEALGYIAYMSVINFFTLLIVENIFIKNIIKGGAL
ncbi:ABC transporter permease [Clostridium sp. D2Q-11]|uniref:ABC transporter permease n=1 Tax=Anaeromonas frigoriresistens TaxID=2683708 RepID=A0A942UYK1_9FIRM|nr:ABC transporter permease [Anaeromonas frigoriresistens]MBS4539366.1 ABC transporter permease [Anaeromonas frigoriresistens]